MTIEEYYIKKQNLKAPEGLNFIQERDWFRSQIKELQGQLSKSDLKTVLERNQEWKKKIQSSHS